MPVVVIYYYPALWVSRPQGHRIVPLFGLICSYIHLFLWVLLVLPGGHVSQEVGVRGRLLLEELPQEAAGDHGGGLLQVDWQQLTAAGNWRQVRGSR